MQIFFPLPLNLLEGDLPAYALSIFFFGVLIPSLSPEANGEEDPREDEQLLEVDEEAALIEAERILEDSEPMGRDSCDRRREEETIAELADIMLAMNLHKADEQPSQGQGQGQEQADNEMWEVRIF